MRPRKLAVAAVALSALWGCERVYSSAPMGEEVASISKADWEGYWLSDDGPIAVQVVDEGAGTIMVSGLDLEPAGDGAVSPPRAESIVVHLRTSGDWLLASVESRDEPGRWEWARIRLDGDRLIAWFPEASAFRPLVSEGALPGTVERGDYGGTTIRLGALSPAQYELITGGSAGVLVDWDDPTVLQRIHTPGSGDPPPPPPPPPPPAR